MKEFWNYFYDNLKNIFNVSKLCNVLSKYLITSELLMNFDSFSMESSNETMNLPAGIMSMKNLNQKTSQTT